MGSGVVGALVAGAVGVAGGDALKVGVAVDGSGAEVLGGVDEDARDAGAVPLAFDEDEPVGAALDAGVVVEDGQDQFPAEYGREVEGLGRGVGVEAVSGKVAGLVDVGGEVGHDAAGCSGWVNSGGVEVHGQRQGGEVLVVAEAVAGGDHEVDVVGVERLADFVAAVGVVAGADVEPGVGVGGGEGVVHASADGVQAQRGGVDAGRARYLARTLAGRSV